MTTHRRTFSTITDEQLRKTLRYFCLFHYRDCTQDNVDELFVPDLFNMLNRWLENPVKIGFSYSIITKIIFKYEYYHYIIKYFDRQAIKDIIQFFENDYDVPIVLYSTDAGIVSYKKLYEVIDLDPTYNCQTVRMMLGRTRLNQWQFASLIVKNISSKDSMDISVIITIYGNLFNLRYDFQSIHQHHRPAWKTFIVESTLSRKCPHNIDEIKLLINHFKYKPDGFGYNDTLNNWNGRVNQKNNC